MSEPVDKVAEYQAMWDSLSERTIALHPDTELEEWLASWAKGVVWHDPSLKDDPLAGKVEWIA